MTERSEIPIPPISKIRNAFEIATNRQDSKWWKSETGGNLLLTNYYGGMTEPPREIENFMEWVEQTIVGNLERFKSEPLRYGYQETMPFVSGLIQFYALNLRHWNMAEEQGDTVQAIHRLGKAQGVYEVVSHIERTATRDLQFVEKVFFKIPTVDRKAYEDRLSAIYPSRKKQE